MKNMKYEKRHNEEKNSNNQQKKSTNQKFVAKQEKDLNEHTHTTNLQNTLKKIPYLFWLLPL